MKVVAALSLLLASTHAFTANIGSRTSASLSLEMTAASANAKMMDRTEVRKSISSMTKETFESTLKDIEPFLTSEAGLTFYSKTIRRIGHKATELGATVPADYALEAKATAKRREKQDAFIKQKIEEATEAEEAAAAAEAEAAESEAEASDAVVAEEELVAA